MASPPTPTPTPSPAIVLIGLRASGKSTLGAELARRLELRFLDLDDVVAESLGAVNAAVVIERDGLAAFREAEQRALAELLPRERAVLALGGGTPTIPDVRTMLRTHPGPVVYLFAKPDTLAERLRATDLSTRPSLTGLGVIEEIAEVFATRDPLYQSLATHVVRTDELKTVAAMTDAIQASLES